MDAVRTVEAEVRELIRRSGLDPAREPGAVQRLVRDAVADYDQRSMHGGMPVLGDVARAEKSGWDTVAGFGPLQQYFDDPTVEEIWINEPTRVFIARGGVAELTTTLLTSDEVRAALADPIEQIVGAVKETLERTPPELSADITRTGILLAALVAHLSRLMTLEPGDIVATGTPSGVGSTRDPRVWLGTGDEIVISSPQLGELRTTLS